MNKTPVIFINKTLLIENSQIDRLVSAGDVQLLRIDGSDYAVSTAFIDTHLDARACKKGWFGMLGNCKQKPKSRDGSNNNLVVNITGGSSIPAVAASLMQPVAVATAGVATAGGLVYVARKVARRSRKAKDLFRGMKRSEIGGPLSYNSKRSKARNKASKAAYGTSNNSTYFSAGAGKDPRPGMGKGSMSETIAGIPPDMSVREARRLKIREFWKKK